MNAKNKIILGLTILLTGFFQNSKAYDYLILNDTGEDIVVQIVTSSPFAPKSRHSIGAGLSKTIQIRGLHRGAALCRINVLGKEMRDADSIGLKRMGVTIPWGNKKFVIRSKDKGGYSIQPG